MRPEQPGNTVFPPVPLFLRYLRIVRARARALPPLPTISLLYFALIFYSSPQAKCPVEVKPRRDKNIDILFASAKRSIAIDGKYIIARRRRGDLAELLWPIHTGRPLLPRWLSATYLVSHRKTVSHFSTSHAGLRCSTRSIAKRHRRITVHCC